VLFRVDMAEAQTRAWSQIARPGTWWTGAERVAIAAETRHSRHCRLCALRCEALTPATTAGTHDSLGALAPAGIEAIHRISTDSGRLGESWFRRLLAAGLTDERYVELVAVVTVAVAIDTFRYAAGLDTWNLPEPQPGQPTFRTLRGCRHWRLRTERTRTLTCTATVPARAGGPVQISIARLVWCPMQ
jgi:hypothetical protein